MPNIYNSYAEAMEKSPNKPGFITHLMPTGNGRYSVAYGVNQGAYERPENSTMEVRKNNKKSPKNNYYYGVTANTRKNNNTKKNNIKKNNTKKNNTKKNNIKKNNIKYNMQNSTFRF